MVSFEVKCKVLYEDMESALELMQEMMFNTIYADKKRLSEIISEGKVLYTLSLSVDQSVTVTTALGTNTVTIENGAVAVTEADCPDHYCMQRGWCRSGTDIVCLPHRVVITVRTEQSTVTPDIIA